MNDATTASSERLAVSGARRRVDPVLLVCSLLIAALAGYGSFLVVDRSGDDATTQANDVPDPTDPLDHSGLGADVGVPGIEAAMKVAEDQIKGLISLNPKGIQRQLKEMSSLTTGEFRRQFEALAPTIVQVVRQGGIDTRGEIVASGLASVEDGTATVLVVSLSAVKNKQNEAPTPRGYRFRVSVSLEDGSWLVSGIEFA